MNALDLESLFVIIFGLIGIIYMIYSRKRLFKTSITNSKSIIFMNIIVFLALIFLVVIETRRIIIGI